MDSEKYKETDKKISIQYDSDENINDIINSNYTNKKNFDFKMSTLSIDKSKASTQYKLLIQGIEVYFPYKPYDLQITYMEKVILSCKTREFAILESPTGTGKTLCLLCASLAWLKNKQDELLKANYIHFPKIYYSTRTHSQISNIIKELRKTCYLPSTSVLGSRDNSCVNPDFVGVKGLNLNFKCKQARIIKKCKYYSNLEKIDMNGKFDIIDIEELYKLGSQSYFCPYYMGKRKNELADIIFLPYNYVFEKKYREALKLEFSNSILLIDEGHNIENVCEDSMSLDISTLFLDDCIKDFNEFRKSLENGILSVQKEKAAKYSNRELISHCFSEDRMLRSIKNYMINYKNLRIVLKPDELFDIFFKGSGEHHEILITDYKEKDCLTPENIQKYIDLVKESVNIIENQSDKMTILNQYVEILYTIKRLYNNYKNMKNENKNEFYNYEINNYKIYIDEIDENNSGNIKKLIVRKLLMQCMNPGYGFYDLIKFKPITMIITSGTLHPISSIESELKFNFPIKLNNPHVIDNKQVMFSILTNSFKDKIQFKFDAQSRNDNKMILELGYSLTDLFKLTPGGILIFFSGYQYMKLCIKEWEDSKIIIEMGRYKEIFKDLQDSQKNKIILNNYKQASLRTQGAVLFSVCRGSSSEGIDFENDYARMVIIVGIPFANIGDRKVQLKKEFLDEYNRITNYKKLTSNEWYTLNAIKAVNQSLGRVIRHIDDYGSIILIDNRFREFSRKKVFSPWLCESLKEYNDNKLLISNRDFFSNIVSLIKDKNNRKKLYDYPILNKNDEINIFEDSIIKDINDNYEKIKLIDKDIDNFNLKPESSNIDNDNYYEYIGKKRYLPSYKSGKDEKVSELLNKYTYNPNDHKDESNSVLNNLLKLKDKSDMNEILKKFKLNEVDKRVTDDKKCPVCLESKDNIKNFKQSKCLHIICSDCWTEWLKKKLECPICKKKVREKHLIEIN